MTCVQGPNKLPYEVWAGQFLPTFDFLRGEGFSLTDLSRLVDKEPGWADAARKYKSMVEESDLKTLEKTMAEVKRNRKRTSKGGLTPELTKAQREEVVAILNELRDDKVLWWQIDQLFGYENGSGSTTVTILKKDGKGCSKERYDHAKTEIKKYRLDKAVYLSGLKKPDKPVRHSTNGTPKSNGSVPQVFSWVAEIHDGLLEFADRIHQESLKVPPDFRAPYDTRRDMLKEMASEFEHGEPSAM